MLKKLSVVAICVAFLCANAMAQDAKTVIANAQKALGDVKSITYSGSAKDVAFQQCGANSTDINVAGEFKASVGYGRGDLAGTNYGAVVASPAGE